MAENNFGKEKANFNLARLKKGGEKFELIIDPDKAMAYKNGYGTLDDVLMYEKRIFADAKKGLQSSESSLQRIFDTTDALKVAEVIIKEGEIQLTSEYRESQRLAKERQIVQLIHRNAIDPRTNLPHPETRIENAIAEAKVRIDEHKSAEDQLDDVIKSLRPILPIKFETRKLQIVVPSKFASQSKTLIQKYGRIAKDSWHSDGTLFAVVELPAGLQQALTDQLNKITRGDIDIKTMEEK